MSDQLWITITLGGCIFADDIVISARGQDINLIHNTIQKALNDINVWPKEESLEFNVSKSCAILFHYCQDNIAIPPLILEGQTLACVNSTKYLCVTLTVGLKWTDHFNRVFEGAKKNMIKINKALHKSIGPSPMLTHWIYTGVIRPKIFYAAHIWCGSISNYILEKSHAKSRDGHLLN